MTGVKRCLQQVSQFHRVVGGGGRGVRRSVERIHSRAWGELAGEHENSCGDGLIPLCAKEGKLPAKRKQVSGFWNVGLAAEIAMAPLTLVLAFFLSTQVYVHNRRASHLKQRSIHDAELQEWPGDTRDHIVVRLIEQLRLSAVYA